MYRGILRSMLSMGCLSIEETPLQENIFKELEDEDQFTSCERDEEEINQIGFFPDF